MVNTQFKPATYIAAVVLLFVLLASARCVFSPLEQAGPDPQLAYEDLASSLTQAGVLPLASPGELLQGYVALVLVPNQISEPTVLTSGVIEAKLAGVVVGRASGNGVFELELFPPKWRDLKPSPARSALRTIAGMNRSQQGGASSQGQSAQASTSPATFSFQIIVGRDKYQCTPYFTGEDCERIVIRLVP
jgi:hypothetical protein